MGDCGECPESAEKAGSVRHVTLLAVGGQVFHNFLNGPCSEGPYLLGVPLKVTFVRTPSGEAATVADSFQIYREDHALLPLLP